MSEADSLGFASMSTAAAARTFQTHAFLWGSLTDERPSWREALASEGDVQMLGEDLSCPTVGGVVLATFACGLAGEALTEQVRARLKDVPSTILHAAVQIKKSQLVDLRGDAAQRHFAYLLDMHAVAGTCPNCPNSRPPFQGIAPPQAGSLLGGFPKKVPQLEMPC